MAKKPSAIPDSERVEPFITLRELRLTIDAGILPDGTRIHADTKRDLLAIHATAVAVCRDSRAIKYDQRLAFTRLSLALGEAGFFGPPSSMPPESPTKGFKHAQSH